MYARNFIKTKKRSNDKKNSKKLSMQKLLRNKIVLTFFIKRTEIKEYTIEITTAFSFT